MTATLHGFTSNVRVPMILLIFPLEGQPHIAVNAGDKPDAGPFKRIINELDEDWSDLLAHAFTLAGMPPIPPDDDDAR